MRLTDNLILADTCRRHLEFLINEQNSNQSLISRETGVGRTTIVAILHHRVTAVTRETHEALMKASGRPPAAPSGFVDALGSRRRTQALIAFGHTIPYIAAKADVSMNGLRALVFDRIEHVDEATELKLERAFALLQMQPGASNAARQLGAERRWKLPFEWDEDSIAVRGVRPYPSSQERMREIRLARQAKAQAVAA
ncbi:hypothetical protein ACQPW1_10480 [Nocardia sp. CA-128927]|uniref:hypothetical protein n=1 Tax=Nocardia sp. CA-128927 TaxID=3239975 RepID=UPI003D988EB5